MITITKIKEAAIDSNTRLPDLLRQCQVLAFELGNNDLKNWVDNELNGYPDDGVLPEYRIINVQSYGNCNNIAWQHSHAPVPLSNIKDEHKEFLKQHKFMGSVASLASIAKDKQGEQALSVPWPHSLLMYYSNEILSGFNFTNIWKEVGVSQIVEVLDTIQNRILRFVLELEKESPDIDEYTSVEETKIQQIVNTFIIGSGTNVTIGGSQQVTYNVDITVGTGDFESLKQYLVANGIQMDDIGNLENAIQDDGDKRPSGGFGEHVNEWFTTMTKKTLSGMWGVAAPTVSALITHGLMKYFGL